LVRQTGRLARPVSFSALDSHLSSCMRSSTNKPTGILLYGFGPYRMFRNNITASIVRSVRSRPGLTKVVFPVRFQRAQFVDAIDRIKPAIILGLGQSSRRKIQAESQALNQRRVRPTKQPRKISLKGPMRLPTTLEFGRHAGRSSDAGDYVCNFSMYVMLDHLRRNNSSIRYGFIHIPHDYDRSKAIELVEKILRRYRQILRRVSPVAPLV
jgi:pyrrolidone-carboxylate peptidase